MERQFDKYPYKKHLYFQWFEAAIANLILFKYLRQKYANHIYFLISDQGIMLKATSSSFLRTVEDQIDRFFNAKIQQLEVSASPDFYENIIGDIKEQTEKLKDSRDCPYINLVYSDKLRNSCLALKKFGYSKPYENWEIVERNKKGFCYLIVRPEHRFRQIASNVMALVRKRQANSQRPAVRKNWTIDMSYQKFIWLYLQPSFEKLKESLDISEKKQESLISVCFKEDSETFMDIDKKVVGLSHKYYQEKVMISQREKQKGRLVVLSALEIQKITELIYHEFGLPNLVRVVRGKGLKSLVVGTSEQLTSIFEPQIKLALSEKPKFSLREDIGQITNGIAILLKLGKRHDLVTYNGLNMVMVRFQLPLRHNCEVFLKHRLPSLPRYIYYIQKNKNLYLLRRFQEIKFRAALDSESLTNQIFLMNSLILIVNELHRRGIVLGNNLSDNVFAAGLRVMIEPAETGTKQEDKSKLVLLTREWVKSMRKCQLKTELQKLNDPLQMLPLLDGYLNEHYI